MFLKPFLLLVLYQIHLSNSQQLGEFSQRCVACLDASSSNHYCVSEKTCFSSQPACASRTQNMFNCNQNDLYFEKIEMFDQTVGQGQIVQKVITVARDSYSYIMIENKLSFGSVHFTVRDVHNDIVLKSNSELDGQSSSLNSHDSIQRTEVVNKYFIFGFNKHPTSSRTFELRVSQSVLLPFHIFYLAVMSLFLLYIL